VVIENQAGARATSAPPLSPGRARRLHARHARHQSRHQPEPVQGHGYDIPRDFKPIVRVAVAPLAIVANPKFAPNTIPELIAAAKARPGTINYGSGGSGSVTHLRGSS
jgi:tripartite-type tricarboxylate transporter receptor subunit TctC